MFARSALFVLVLSGCCCGSESGPPRYFITSAFGFFTCSSPMWNGTTATQPTRGSVEFIDVALVPWVQPGDEMLEFYLGTEHLGLAGETIRGAACPGGCPVDRVRYDLRGLPAGEYLVIHRLASAPPRYTTSDGPTTTFEGETALVTTIVLARRQGGLDGGSDASP